MVDVCQSSEVGVFFVEEKVDQLCGKVSSLVIGSHREQNHHSADQKESGNRYIEGDASTSTKSTSAHPNKGL